jgi:hypothetical protein
LKSIFNPPSEPEIECPQSSYVKNLILEQKSSYWESGGDAAVRYIDDQGHTYSEMIFLLRDPMGAYIQFFPANGVNNVAGNGHSDLKSDVEITVTHCGSPLTLPAHYFVDRQTAAQIVSTFVENGDGQQPSGFNWIET